MTIQEKNGIAAQAEGQRSILMPAPRFIGATVEVLRDVNPTSELQKYDNLCQLNGPVSSVSARIFGVPVVHATRE